MNDEEDLPQPLKHVAALTLADVQVSPSTGPIFSIAAIEMRPQLAVMLVQITVAWAKLEQKLGESLAHTLKTQPDIGMEVFFSLEHNSAQFKVVLDTAALVLDKADFALFNAIVTLAKRCGRQRNIVAHGIWGISDKVPNGLVLLKANDLTRIIGPLSALGLLGVPPTLQSYLENEEMRKNLTEYEQMVMGVPQKVVDTLNESLVYFDRDFVKIRDEVGQTTDFIHGFWALRHRKPDERERLRRQLCSAPAIQKVLFHQSKDR